MKRQDILGHAPKVLTQGQREQYFDDGYLCVENLVPGDLLEELNRVTSEFVDASRAETKSGAVFDVGPGHGPEQPVLRRLKKPDQQHDAYWRFASGLMADVAADLVGPDVVFHHSKLNFKWFDETDSVKWHQDAQFFPHTNYNVLTIGCYLADTDMNNGPLAVLPGSHNRDLYDQYDGEGNWTGCLSQDDAEAINMADAVYLTGPAGSITVHNCRTVHYSPSSKSPHPRPLLLNCYTSSDAKPYTPHPDPSDNTYKIVRGEPARWADHDPRPCQIPPDWLGGYTSIYAAQAGEDAGM